MTVSFVPQFKIRRQFAARFIGLFVLLHGVFVLAITLLDQFAARKGTRLSDITIDIPLLVGLGLIYLSSLLARRKQIAWLAAVAVYAFLLGLNTTNLVGLLDDHRAVTLSIIRLLLLPVIALVLLAVFRRDFMVRSDIQAFGSALLLSITILSVALVYGVVGFSLLDKPDFHQEIGLAGALHRTIDQFDLTTNKPLTAYSKRAQLFQDSLSFVSIAAIGYAVVSLFQPLRERLGDQTANRQRIRHLLETHGAPSEDFFKLWPHDKQYFFERAGQAALALTVFRGVALVVGDPAGDRDRFRALIEQFDSLCFYNDWTAAFVHVDQQNRALYETAGYSLQRIGQEAVVDIEHFNQEVGDNKYFRQISNRFLKLGFSYESLSPPHHPAVLQRLRIVSDEWLSRPGRAERKFIMGSFSEAYMQQCKLLIARDAAGTIQAFLNQLPSGFDARQANFDLLRYANQSPGNCNDFVLLNFIKEAHAAGYTTLSLGLCPLAGLDADDENKSMIDTVLGFAYANGDRFYSFSGLYRFKNKYQPQWSDRFIAYKGGVRDFSRIMNALLGAMRVKKSRS